MRSRPHVLVTRALGRNRRLTSALASIAQVTELPLIAFEAVPHTLPAQVDRLVITSATALAFVDARALAGVSTAAVGPHTRDACVRAGLRVDVVPDQALGGALVQALGDLQGQRVLYLRAETVPPELEQGLRAAGAELTSTAVYRTVCPAGARAALREIESVDAVLLASGSAASHLQELGGSGLPVFCIGPSTEAVARELGFQVLATAQPHTAEGLAQCVADWIRKG